MLKNNPDITAAILKQYGVRAMHPDKYLTALLKDTPELFLTGVKDHHVSLKRPPKSVEEYLETLKTNGLPQVAEHLERHREAL